MEAFASKKKPRYCVHENGFIMPFGFKPENFVSALSYIPRDSDIFVCTYPKCGTTWMQCILQLMGNAGNPLKTGQNINEYIPHLEEVGRQSVEALSEPRIIKTHLPYNLVPKRTEAKYIYIARNPKDCCVSYYHHTKGFVKHYQFGDGTFEDFFELFLAGKVDFNDYFDNLLSWVNRKGDPNVFFLLYEDMKDDIKRCIKNIGEFLGGTFLAAVEDSSILEKVIANSNINVMKATPSAWSSERSKEFEPFIRKGKVGDWRSHFSEEQSRRLDQKFKRKFSGTKAENLWERFDC